MTTLAATTVRDGGEGGMARRHQRRRARPRRGTSPTTDARHGGATGAVLGRPDERRPAHELAQVGAFLVVGTPPHEHQPAHGDRHRPDESGGEAEAGGAEHEEDGHEGGDEGEGHPTVRRSARARRPIDVVDPSPGMTSHATT